MLVEIGNQHVGPLAGIGDCDGAANAAVTTRDHGFHALEPSRTLVRLLAVIRLRRHEAGQAGHILMLFGKRGLGCRYFGHLALLTPIKESEWQPSWFPRIAGG